MTSDAWHYVPTATTDSADDSTKNYLLRVQMVALAKDSNPPQSAPGALKQQCE